MRAAVRVGRSMCHESSRGEDPSRRRRRNRIRRVGVAHMPDLKPGLIPVLVPTAESHITPEFRLHGRRAVHDVKRVCKGVWP